MHKQRFNQIVLRTLMMGAFLSFILLFCAQSAKAATLAFNFTLASGATTSAGAYKPDGTMVRTLWRKVYYPSGTHSYTWDGKDDSGANVAAGSYQFKIVAHNIQYIWDGAIANTSQAGSGTSIHRAFHPINDMAITGTDAFYVSGYNEAQFSFNRFLTSAPQVVTKKWRWIYNPQFSRVENKASSMYDRSWKFTATDGSRVYFGVPVGTNPTTRVEGYMGFITASNVSDSSHAPFTNGVNIPEGPNANEYLANGIYVGTQAGLSGLAVQTSGSLLAAAVAPDNKVYLFNKTSGAASGSITVTAPKRIEFASNGDLWVTTGTTVVRYTPSGSPNVWTVATTITGFSNPLDVAVHPSNNNIVMVADGGSSQQVKAYNSTGTSLWTYGTAGGYVTNGATVANNKFWFDSDAGEDTYISIQSDGSFWVGDGGNRRSLHFSSSRSYIDQIAYAPHSYTCSVDRNSTGRVFSEFLEYSVDYSQPAKSSWTLVKNWGAGLSSGYFAAFMRGLRQTVTLSNGRTYAIASNNGPMMLFELVSNNARLIGPFDQATGESTTINPNGDLIKLIPNTPSWTRRVLTGFDGSNNPIWAAATNVATASNGSTDPSPRCCGMGAIAAPITTSNVIVSYDQSLNNGFHLGGVSVGGSSWLWKAMPAVTSNVPLDGLGSYDIGDSITYAGNTAVVANRHIIAGFHGEFYMNQGQAGQFMHFFDNGLFLGQFGESGIGYTSHDGVIAGFAGNGFSPELVRAPNGEYYLWVNDESAYGPQRWHLVGANNVREYSGSGTLGGSAVTITVPAAGFPTNLAATPGNAAVSLNWTGVSGATSYNVKYSTISGGPYTSVSGITGNSYTKTGLTNNTRYYFVVSAVVGGTESNNSDEATTRPFDTSVVVQIAGQQSSIQKVFPVTSTAPAAGKPALPGLKRFVGDLTLTDVGAKGYRIFNYGGAGVDSTNVLSPFTVTKGSGWADETYVKGDFKVDGVSSAESALKGNPAGTINISVSDTDFHILTVFSTVRFDDDRTFTIKLTPQGLTTPVASYTVTNESPGRNHTYQFLFKGNVTLTMDNTGGTGGLVQAIFLDNYNMLTTPAAPSGLTTTAGNAQVALSWSATADAASYNVYRGTTSNGQSGTAIQTGITGTTYTNTGLTNGTAYYYKIKAVNSAGTSAYSNEASATPTTGSGSVVTSVRYVPRQSWASRMVNGQFQGSNDNSIWTTLATVTTAPPESVYTTASVSNTTAFRYLRYLSPSNSYGNVAEIEFYNGATKLSGTQFGSTGLTGLSYPQVFDGNTSTFLECASANGNYAGIDLGP